MSDSIRQRLVGMSEVITENSSLTGADTDAVRLYSWDEIPDWQKDNHYIVNGYVRETNSFKKCYESLWYLHNESVNILSHLVPGILVTLMLLGSLAYVLIPITVHDTTTRMDYFVIGLFLFGATCCFMLSATFHCIKCHSEAVSILSNKLDYLGIVIMIVTSMVGIIYYSFIDQPRASFAFNAMVMSFGAVCCYVSLKEKFRRPAWRGVRAGIFVAFGLSAVIPILYGLIHYHLDEVWKRSGLGYVLLELFFYIAGAALYGTRFPERCCPGRLDYFGNSHQIFHFFVVIAAYCHATALIQSYDYAHGVTVLQQAI